MADLFIQYSDSDKPVGPFQMEELEGMVRARQVEPETLFSERGSGRWQEARVVFRRLGIAVRRPAVLAMPAFYEEGFFILGSIALVVGLLFLFGAWLSGIAVDTTPWTGSVVNLGKVSDRELWALTGIGLAVVGAMWQLMGVVVFFGKSLKAKG